MYYSVKAPCILILLIFVLGSCENKTSNTTTNNGNYKGEASISISPKFLQQNFPVLDSISRTKEGLHQLLNGYAFRLKNASTLVESDKDLQELFEMRDNDILTELHKKVLDPIALENGVFYHSAAGAKLDEELKELGMQAVYSEGMYWSLGPAEMLTEEMEKYASEVFRLYMDFQSARTDAIMGEYPYLNLDGEGKMLVTGEKMQEKYPDNPLTKKIETDFNSSLEVFTDVHIIKSDFDKSYMTNGLATEFYPNATNIDALKKFTEDYPESKYGKMVETVIKNMSEMEPKEIGWKDLYLVVVQWADIVEKTAIQEGDTVSTTFKSCINARKICNDFLKKGITISHSLQVKKKDEEKCAVVYRFYADKKKAETALKEIKKEVPETVGIVQLTYDPLEKMWVAN